ncbi:MAG: hypothetical protein QOG09_76 [Solirubrobacterales bacterium]|nr:hypothetical protein [Solirubrobacterales bacterium]
MSLRDRLRSERGMAVPSVMMLVVVGLGFGSAALVSSVSSQSSTTRDSRIKGSIAAADAGLDRAIYRENKILTTTSLPCVLMGVGGSLIKGVASGDGWCPAVTGSVGTTTYSYRVKPWTLVTLLGRQGRQITIVSTGTANGISRRISETAFSPLGAQVFGSEGVIGKDGITMNGNANTNVAMGTDGNITASGNATICNNARHGPNKTITYTGNAHQCPGYSVTTGTVSLPNPDQSDALANSSTSRFFTTDPKTGNVTWDAATRSLSMSGNSTLTLGGSSYSLCSLSMSGNSTLYMAAGAKVQIFFDTPESCNLSGSQIDLSGNSAVTSTAYNPALGNFDLPGFFLMGSDTISTSVSITGNGGTDEFLLYGPRTDISLSGNGSMTYVGAVAGKTVSMSGNASITSSAGAPPPVIPTLLLYGRQRYVECTGATGTPPDANC